ncbi:MAG TPA: hypothetical protein VKN76_03750 [Kiloniellaceae bacterium]|nr:hypothetical protein [Kiloniellaceae bacterium]
MAVRPTMEDLGEILDRARRAAIDYYRLTGKPLGITGEIGEYEAARLLGLDLADAREPGYDATSRDGTRYQIKTRALPESAKGKSQQVGSIRLDHAWDKVLLVLLDENFETTEIWQAGREAVTAAIRAPGSKARNERGSLAVSKFKSIGERIWRCS